MSNESNACVMKIMMSNENSVKNSNLSLVHSKYVVAIYLWTTRLFKILKPEHEWHKRNGIMDKVGGGKGLHL